MTREQFIVKAIRMYEASNVLPTGWWGNYGCVEGPHGVMVKHISSKYWRLSQYDEVISRHDSRVVAIRKARELVRQS